VPAYSITEVEVLDAGAAERYADIAGSSVAQHGGRFLVLAAQPELVEGGAPANERIVVLEFPTMTHLRAWYDSPEYAPGREIAETALRRRLRFVDGVEDTPGATTAEPRRDVATTVHRFYEAMSTGAIELADELLTPDWEDVPVMPGTGPGPAGYQATITYLRSVFPDLTMTVEDVVVDGQKVAVRSTARGTHSGDILGVAATGRRVEFAAFDVHHLREGRIACSWHLEDYAGLLDQLQAAPAPQQ